MGSIKSYQELFCLEERIKKTENLIKDNPENALIIVEPHKRMNENEVNQFFKDDKKYLKYIYFLN